VNRLLIVLLCAAGLSACSEVKSLGCDPQIDHAVMEKVIPLGDYPSDEGVSLGSDSAESVQQYQKRIDALKAWVTTAGLDRCTRAAYDGWIGFLQRETDSAKRELKDHARQHEYDQYEAEQKQKEEQAAEYDRTHAIPAPPEGIGR
jgi:hypothetical protein